MNNAEFISIRVYATHQEVDQSFIQALHDRGLIHLIEVDDDTCVTCDELSRLEKLSRMHYELEINIEGIEAISHLLERMEAVQDDLRTLREKLQIYEGGR